MNPTLSTTPVPAAWEGPVNSRVSKRVGFETGGATLGVGSDSFAYTWKVETDGSSVWVSREGVDPALILTGTAITEVDLAFDPTMNAHIAYVEDGVAKWRYWDTLSDAYATMTLTGSRTPRCCTDEKTPELSSDRDVVLSYLRGTSLYVRLQRDRFTIEYEKVPDDESHEPILSGTGLVTLAMNKGRRLQWRFA